MKEFLVGLVISYLLIATLIIWVSVLAIGFSLILTSYAFLVFVPPIVGFLCIVSVIKHGLKLIGRITQNV